MYIALIVLIAVLVIVIVSMAWPRKEKEVETDVETQTSDVTPTETVEVTANVSDSEIRVMKRKIKSYNSKRNGNTKYRDTDLDELDLEALLIIYEEVMYWLSDEYLAEFPEDCDCEEVCDSCGCMGEMAEGELIENVAGFHQEASATVAEEAVEEVISVVNEMATVIENTTVEPEPVRVATPEPSYTPDPEPSYSSSASSYDTSSCGSDYGSSDCGGCDD